MDPLLVAILLFVAAVALAVLDIFVPSGGVLVVLSAIAAVGSVMFGFRSSNTAGMVILTCVLAAIPVILIAALKIWPHTPIGRRIILPTPKKDSGEEKANDPLHALVGELAVTQSALMPTGHVRLNHRNYNAVAEQGLIEAGQTVEILAVRERNLVVAVTTRKPNAAPVQVPEPEPTATGLLDLPAEELGLDSLDN